MTTVNEESANAPKKTRKAPGTAWVKGQSGNPAGKPVGLLNKKTVLAMTLMSNDLNAITKVVIDAAKGGDMQAAKFIIERLVPAMRERPLAIDLPPTDTLEGISDAQQIILSAVSQGELLPGEGTTLSGIVEQRRKAIETQELEQRIAALESKQ